jgi:hypothetical protein
MGMAFLITFLAFAVTLMMRIAQGAVHWRVHNFLAVMLWVEMGLMVIFGLLAVLG